VGEGRHPGQAGQLGVAPGEVAGEVRLAVGAGVQLDDRGADAVRRLDLAAVGGDEYRDTAAGVLERREERTTEGGLEVANDENRLAHFITPLRDAGIRVSIFIAADRRQIEAAHRIGAPVIELHTGAYCEAGLAGDTAEATRELGRLRDMAAFAHGLGLEVHAGHGLTFDNVAPVAAFPEVMELNIGHFLVGEAIFVGLGDAIGRMRAAMDNARQAAFPAERP
jgi:pyridoxine 5-phosphate synthase